MNPIERIFTSIIQTFLRIAVELVRGLFGLNRPPREEDENEERPQSEPDE